MDDDRKKGSLSARDQFDSLGDFGSLGDLAESTVALDASQLSDYLHDGIPVDAPVSELMAAGAVRDPAPLPCTQATMECLRGPCCHLWHWVEQLPAQSAVVAIQRSMACMRHVQIQSLVDQNVFTCDQWWPTVLLWISESMRPLLRPVLRRAWDGVLQLRGEKFPWRWWPRNVFLLSVNEVSRLRSTAIKASRDNAKARPSSSWKEI